MDMNKVLEEQKKACLNAPYPAIAQRREKLKKLYTVVKAKIHDVEKAISSDFSHRSGFETQMAETSLVLQTIKHNLNHLNRWTRPDKRHVAQQFKPGKAYIQYRPKGVVGIISPWNYPFQLAMNPLIAALAAGNRVMLKPSEFTPNTSRLLKSLLCEVYEEDEVAVIEGDADIAVKFSKLNFDHIFFTGSTNVGRYVMRAAAEKLIPVTLELGGKSPTLILDDYSLEKAAERIMVGKLLNAGQTCTAPDYILISKSRRAELINHLVDQTQKLYPSIQDNDDYSAIISERHFQRLEGLLKDGESKGATLQAAYPEANIPENSRKMPPVIMSDLTDEMNVMKEEIFGPITAIVEYDDLDDAIQHINTRPHPLALYCFSRDNKATEKVMKETTSGGVTINDTLLHVAQEDMPFGGVGESGMGSYHGFDGFKTFSHARSVFVQSRLNGMGLLKPPYSNLAHKIVSWLA